MRPTAPWRFLLLGILASSCPAPTAEPGAHASERPPNIVLLLVDDLGWADLASYGNSYNLTPHIDQLAREGVHFTQAYAAAPNCSPSRASLLTGRWPARYGLTQYLPGEQPEDTLLVQPDLPEGLPHDETTVAELLRARGYTTASIGKWHLGGAGYLPEEHGFELNFGGGSNGRHRRLFAPYGVPPIPANEGEFLTDRLTRRALRFIEQSAEQPFFLYMSYYAVHEPIGGRPDDVARFEERAKGEYHSNAEYAAMLTAVDDSVGRIRAKLAKLGLADDTVVLFFSDNGGSEKYTSNFPLRAGKGWLYEGGIRDPLIARIPGEGRTGATCGVPVTGMDLFPTMLELAGVDETPNDGTSLVALVTGDAELDERDLYWHYPHYSHSGAAPCGAIRRGDLKLIEFFEDERIELYDVARDPSEANDLAAQRPDAARELLAALRAWRERVGARMPTRH